MIIEAQARLPMAQFWGQIIPLVGIKAFLSLRQSPFESVGYNTS